VNSGREYLAIYQVECAECGHSPVVGLRTPSGHIASTGLCGSHFFGDRSKLDPEDWNTLSESTE
jgi:hypothetical protein